MDMQRPSILMFCLICNYVCIFSPPNGLQTFSGVAVMNSAYFGSPTTSNSISFVQQALQKHLFTEDHAWRVRLHHITSMILSRCTDWFLGYLQTVFSRWAIAVIIFQTEKMVSANEFATFHLALCHSSMSQNPDCLGKKEKEIKGFRLKPSQQSQLIFRRC